MNARYYLYVWILGLIYCSPGIVYCSTPWAEKDFNPQPLEGDFFLPLPCGGQMAFRRIDVPVDGVLGDHRIMIGETKEQVIAGQRFAFISGGFSDDSQPSLRYYYIGKYEVTKAQYHAFKGGCDSSTNERGLPMTRVNWHDAVEFTRQYTEWLLGNSPEALPKEDGQFSYVRLATEVEWEYATRGGIKVSEAEFQGKTFPMTTKLNDYAWYAGTQSSHGELQYIGLLKPNPLGLFDVLGNVDEIVLESFHANRYGRLHGLSGGYIIKGGNYHTPKKSIRSAARQEQWHFDQAKARRSPTIGFRVVISTPVVTSRERLKALKQEWDRLSVENEKRRTGDLSASEGDLIQELDALEKQLTLVNQKNQLDIVTTLLKGNIAERNAQRNRAAKSMLRLGAFLGQKIYDDSRILKRKHEVSEALGEINRKKAEEIKKSISKGRLLMGEVIAYYQDIVVNVGQEYTLDVLDIQLDTLSAEFKERGRSQLSKFAKHFHACVKHFNATGQPQLDSCFYVPLSLDQSLISSGEINNASH